MKLKKLTYGFLYATTMEFIAVDFAMRIAIGYLVVVHVAQI